MKDDWEEPQTKEKRREERVGAQHRGSGSHRQGRGGWTARVPSFPREQKKEENTQELQVQNVTKLSCLRWQYLGCGAGDAESAENDSLKGHMLLSFPCDLTNFPLQLVLNLPVGGGNVKHVPSLQGACADLTCSFIWVHEIIWFMAVWGRDASGAPSEGHVGLGAQPQAALGTWCDRCPWSCTAKIPWDGLFLHWWFVFWA